MSQPETELDSEEMSDDAILDQMAKKREEAGQPAAEGAEAEDEEETPEPQGDDGEEVEAEEDPEYDLGDLKAKKSDILRWKAGEMKDADYRRKTAEVAEAKREAIAIRERVEQERNHYANQLDVLIGELQTELVGDQQALAQLAASDPAEWVRQNAYQQQRIQRLHAAMQERQAIEQRAMQESQQAHQERVRAELELAVAAVPDWRDQARMQADLNEIDAFVRRAGFSDNDLPAFLDHRILLLARSAMQAEKQAQARDSVKSKKVTQPPPKAIKAGAAPQEQKASQDAYEAAKKRARSGKEDDLMALLAAKRARSA